MFSISHVRRAVIAAGIAGVIALAAIVPASAHVVVSPSNTAAGSYALLTFSFGHGCEGAATTELAIQIPDSIEVVRPANNALWSFETVTAPVAGTPETDGHGPRITEVIFTANAPVPDGVYDQVAIQVKLPEGQPGDIVYFPVVQTCETGETAWIQMPAEGQSSEELEAPAPSLVLTEASEGGH